MDIVGIGVSVWDRVFTLDEFPDEGTVVQAKASASGLGGGVAVATATAAMLGCSCGLIDSLGNDEAGDQIIHRLIDSGVNTAEIQRHDHLTSSTAGIWSSLASRERTIAYVPGTACGQLRWTQSLEETLEQAAIIHTNGRHRPIWERALEIATARGSKISFDGGAHRFREELIPLLRASDIAIVARQFAESFAASLPSSRPRRFDCRELLLEMKGELKAEVVGVTDGEHGSFFIDIDGKVHHQPAVAVELASDSTGCGDTFHGGFLFGYARGLRLERSAELASEVASLNARSVGALTLNPSSIRDLLVGYHELR